MIFYSADSDDYLGYLIMRGERNEKKVKKKTLGHLNTNLLPIFQMIGTKRKIDDFLPCLLQLRQNLTQP